MDLGNPTGAVREFQAVLAGPPIDVGGRALSAGARAAGGQSTRTKRATK